MDSLRFSLKAPSSYIERVNVELPHSYRSEFMRDRDRIMYSKAFRRLSSKTQIFVSGFDDHVRNRLTHTLEVSQIARTISTYLKLDVDLTEAIALGHDLGHTPFGHIGERTLNLIMNGCDPLVRDYLNVGVNDIKFEEKDKGFKHNLQSLRIAIDLENPGIHTDYKGLNLTNFTLYGCMNHSSTEWKPCKYENNGICYIYPKSHDCKNKTNLSVGYYNKYNEDIDRWSFESFVVAWADEIAQRHHDIEDAIEGKLLNDEQAIKLIHQHFSNCMVGNDEENFDELSVVKGTQVFLSKLSKFLINYLVNSLIETSITNIKGFAEKHSIRKHEDFKAKYLDFDYDEVSKIITISNNIFGNHNAFKEDLENVVHNSYSVHRMDAKAQFMIRRLFMAYLSNPQQLPDKTIVSLFREYNSSNRFNDEVSRLRRELEDFKKHHLTSSKEENSVKFRIALLRTICDYIAGMTDSYATKEYAKLYN
jgi:dGTPase